MMTHETFFDWFAGPAWCIFAVVDTVATIANPRDNSLLHHVIEVSPALFGCFLGYMHYRASASYRRERLEKEYELKRLEIHHRIREQPGKSD